MPCPSCGGTARNEIAPGYFHCVSDRMEVHPTGGFDGRPIPVSVECGIYYQEVQGSGVPGQPICDCGTFAVRRCVRCSQPLCGTHGKPMGEATGRWHCLQCVNQIESEFKDRVLAQQTENAARYRALPPMSRNQLLHVLRGQDSSTVDGSTHQIWDWSCRDIAELFTTEFGEDRSFPIKGEVGNGLCLTPSGQVVVERRVSTGHEYGLQYTVETKEEYPNSADARWTQLPMYLGWGGFQTFDLEPYHVDEEAVDVLKKMYAKTNGQSRPAEKRPSDQRATATRDAVSGANRYVVWLAVLLLVGIVLVSLIV